MKRFLLFSSLVILAFARIAAAQAPVDLILYRDDDSLTLYVRQTISLRDFTFQAAMASGDPISRRLQTYPAFVTLDFSAVAAPACFRLERAGSTLPLPLECQGSANRFVQTLNDADVFWYDRAARQGRVVMVTRGNIPYGVCPAGDAECRIPYVPAEEIAPAAASAEARGPVVLIADFDQRLASTPVDIARRLETDLQRRLRDNRLQGVTVKVVPLVSSEAEAEALLANEDASAIVWGWYDSLGINVRVFLASGSRAVDEIASVGEIPLGMTDSPGSELAFVVRNVLPENVSFVSMFVIGHLRYRANQYQAGHDAFDAAMSSIPENVSLENKALVHFFNGRQLIESGSTDYAAAICEYAQALQLQPDFAEAYNNLGIVFSMFDLFDELPEQATSCLDEYETQCRAAWPCFNKARELQPESAVYEMNMLTTYWRGGYITSDFLPQVEALLARDPSMAGGQVMAGGLKLEDGDLDGAAAAYEAALAIKPDWPEARINLGQIYLRRGDFDKAQQMLDTALRGQPENEEANLARANLAAMRGNGEEALLYLDRIPRGQPDAEHARESAHILRALIFAAAGQDEAAAEELQFLPYDAISKTLGDPFANYLLGVLAARDELAGSILKPEAVESVPLYNLMPRVFSAQENNTAAVAWYDLVEKCSVDGIWDTQANPCLPEDQRVDTLYELFRGALLERIGLRRGVLLGAACPFVYTWDGTAWALDTVILYNLVGAEAEAAQPRALQRFDGRLRIREIEPETSYINRIVVQITDGSGRIHILASGLPELQASDDRYLILNQGDDVLLEFAGYDEITDIRDAQVIAEGYYVPYWSTI